MLVKSSFELFIATNELLPRSGNIEGWLLLRLEALFCSIHLLYEGLISILSKQSSGIYTESIRSYEEPYSTFEKCAVIIIHIEKIQKVKVNHEAVSFVDI